MPALNFLSDPLWQRVAWALLHFVWQGAVVGMVLFTVLSLVRAAQVRYWLALGAMALLVACPLVTMAVVEVEGVSEMVDPHPSPLPQGEGAGMAIDVQSAVAADDNNWREAALNVLVALRPYMLLAWLAGVLALGTRLLTSYLMVRRVRSSAVELRHPLLLTTYWLARKLRLRGKVRIAVSHAIEEALVLGLWRPLILVPASWLTEMPAATLEAIIAHELAHIRRHDLWVNLAQRVVETLLFYHPAVWYVSRVLRVEREQCCDLLAVAATGERLVYVEALELVASKRLAASPALLAAAMGGTKPMNLLARVQNVLGMAPSTSSARYWPVGVAALVLPAGMWCASLAFSPVATAQEEAKENADAKAATVIDEFVRQRLEKIEVPGADGDKATFLRRLMLDLTGVPPTPEEAERFQKAGDEDARSFIRVLVAQEQERPREGDDRAPLVVRDRVREGDDRAPLVVRDRVREGDDRAPLVVRDRVREGDDRAPLVVRDRVREGDDRAPLVVRDRVREGDRPREGADRIPLGIRVRVQEGDQPREGDAPRAEANYRRVREANQDQPAREGADRGDVRQLIDEQMRLIREMRNEMQQLRREINELRERRGQDAPAEGVRRIEADRQAIRAREEGIRAEALRALQSQRDEAAAQRDRAEAARREAERARSEVDRIRGQSEEAVKRAAVEAKRAAIEAAEGAKRADADRLEALTRAKQEAVRAQERKREADKEAAARKEKDVKEAESREKAKEGEKKQEEKKEGGERSVRRYELPGDPGATKALIDEYLSKDGESSAKRDGNARLVNVFASPEQHKMVMAILAKTRAAAAQREKEAGALKEVVKEKTEAALKEVQLKLESVAKEKVATKIILDKVKAEKAPAKKEAVKKEAAEKKEKAKGEEDEDEEEKEPKEKPATKLKEGAVKKVYEKIDKDASKEERKEKEVTKEREDKAETKTPKTTIVLELKKEKQEKDAKAEEKSEKKTEKEDKEEKDEDDDD